MMIVINRGCSREISWSFYQGIYSYSNPKCIKTTHYSDDINNKVIKNEIRTKRTMILFVLKDNIYVWHWSCMHRWKLMNFRDSPSNSMACSYLNIWILMAVASISHRKIPPNLSILPWQFCTRRYTMRIVKINKW